MSDFINVDNQIVSITIIKSDTEILSIAEETAISMSIIDVGLQGIRGVKGDKGDTFVYSDLTEEQKRDFASRIEIDTSILNTDLQAIYILNKE